MKKTNIILQQCLAKTQPTRVVINNPKYKNASGVLLSCNKDQSRIFIENLDSKILTVPSSIVKITEFDNMQLSLEQLLPVSMAIAGSNSYYSININDILECKNLKNLNFILNEKGIKNSDINYIHYSIIEESTGALIIFTARMLFPGFMSKVVNKLTTKENLDKALSLALRKFPNLDLNIISKYGPIVVHIGYIIIIVEMFKNIIKMLGKNIIQQRKKIIDFDALKNYYDQLVSVQERLLEWLKYIGEPITQSEAKSRFKDSNNYFVIEDISANFLNKINNLGDNYYSNEATKDIFYFDQANNKLYIANKFHKKKHINLDKARDEIKNNADSIVDKSIFYLAPSNSIKDWWEKLKNKLPQL